jgi:hypothetical protein
MLASRRTNPTVVYRLPEGGRYLEALQTRYEQDGEIVRCGFEGAMEELPIAAEWRPFDGLPEQA